jgi:hypothetical protein
VKGRNALIEWRYFWQIEVVLEKCSIAVFHHATNQDFCEA